ncbi:hypothetical protein BASA50_001334 [Batrachochytrium salamandrivorans]|uniref:Methylated-DNA--protein-cysteine methyltransferase n=1 Tax=Batrachochytrium salamandrivorans TaxID=1357716 RepID=A0ABQ8EV92_9FUNG|nr:hypothetical protein BASA50_001334 [Batrachochytrium salamandrivorans]KAH6602710.1 hypothetical protein BASA61_000875 [Batrachochytrium salamandrivorans]KAH9254789.1 hypothetical protein BASA81_007209 [Batrachochytrium salamandrivorans]KAJ1345349.1 hypothetical protein BSLG_000862 [Batrachochytrium salamandrivorans]
MPVSSDSTTAVTDFQSKVYGLCAQIPSGSFATYKDISDALKSSPRAVGQALKRNPFAPTVPCHRVLSSNFYLGGFLGDWGSESYHGNRKLIMLQKEDLHFDADGFLNKDLQTSSHFTLFDTVTPVTSSEIACKVASAAKPLH